MLRAVLVVSDRYGLFHGLSMIENRKTAMAVGELVLPPGYSRPWRIVDIYHDGRADLEFIGEAWVRRKVRVPVANLRPYPGETELVPHIPTPAEILREFGMGWR